MSKKKVHNISSDVDTSKRVNNTKNKPRFPLFKSLGELVLLVVILAVLSTYSNDILLVFFTADISITISEILNYIFLVIGIGGSVLILVDNLSGKQMIKNVFSKILGFYKNFKVHWKFHATFLTIVVALIVYSQIIDYNSSNKLCGSNGDIYYCNSGDEVVCENDLIPVFDNKTYKCVDNRTYRHDYEHQEYTYICTEKYDENNNSKDELISAEKECLLSEITKEAETKLADIKKDIPTSYDVRDKVAIKAGVQGASSTCYLWSETKALEISAQLKGVDYQFLLDFEKEINNIKTLSPTTGGINESTCYGDECIPGSKKNIYISEFGLTDSDLNPKDNKYYPEFSDKFKKYRNAYFLLPDAYNIFNDSSFILNSDEYLNLVTKYMIMKYGASFIISTDENSYIDKTVGHQMTIIGWDDDKGSWLVLNSWGNTWSNKHLKSNGDGTTWIKYSDKGWSASGSSIELLGQ